MEKQLDGDFSGPGFRFRAADKIRPSVINIRAWSPQLDEVLLRTGVKHVLIDNWDTGDEGEPQFLARYAAQIEKLEILDETLTNLSAVSQLVNLRELVRWGTTKGIDFSQLQRLQCCSIRQSPQLGNLPTCPSLKWLSVENAKVKDLAIFSTLPNLWFLAIGSAPLRALGNVSQLVSLRTLQIQECRGFTSLAGIEATRIEEMFLAWLPQLGSIAPLSQVPTLRQLHVITCNRVTDLESVGEITTLEKLILDGRQKLPSLAFLRRLKQLREFLCGDIEILDGNLEVLLTLPKLERVVIMSRKHYSHTGEELTKLLQAQRKAGKHETP